MVWKRLLSVAVAAITIWANWLLYLKFGSWAHMSDPWWFATTLVVSVTIHEFCHWAVFEYNGVKAYFFLAVVMGGTTPYPSSEKRLTKLNWNTQAQVAMAGLAGNLAILVVSAVLCLTGMMTIAHARVMTNVNAGLILFNLIPLWGMDGHRFAKAFFDSVPEDQDMKYVHGFTVLVVICLFVTTIYFHQAFFAPALMVWGLTKDAEQDDPKGSRNRLAMTQKQQKRWAFAYASMAALSIIVSGMVPLAHF